MRVTYGMPPMAPSVRSVFELEPDAQPWTGLEQIGRMAAEAMAEDKDESDVVVTLRRAVRDHTNGTPRWTVTIGQYSSKACKTPEEALEEVAGMYRSALLARIERCEKRITRARAALPTDASSDAGGPK